MNALRLGLKLTWAAINPWSGISRVKSRIAQWQPGHQYGLPRWWPFGAFKGKPVSLEDITLMKSRMKS